MAAVVLDELCNPDDFKKYETMYRMEMARGCVSKSTQFQYAWCLVRTSNRQNLGTGANLLEDLFRRGRDDSEKRDYLYYMAVAYAKLKEYERALSYLDGILKVQPGNRQVYDLREEIKKRMKKDGLMGIAIASGAAAVGIAGVATLIGLAVSRK